ncbi:unnamed protein product [Miscanthus lutarioriparius]|uniref:Uncharacterized protein n=1 Tax=Miscanthus lutarioriparius TaxID=422564 RepID=A0A811SP12_9POAL|nr:unnamed protein product [Miscanthus lutarioriparius]
MVVVLDALASYLQDMLLEMAKEEVHLLLCVPNEIKKMGMKLGDLKRFLADADKRNISDESVKSWARELRNAMYDATNILDLCQLKALERGRSSDMGCFNPLLFCMRNPLHAHDIGGIGKTTLAKKIFNHDFIKQEFQKRIWLSVNQEFSDVDLLERAIIKTQGNHQAPRNTKAVTRANP